MLSNVKFHNKLCIIELSQFFFFWTINLLVWNGVSKGSHFLKIFVLKKQTNFFNFDVFVILMSHRVLVPCFEVTYKINYSILILFELF